eukprot:4525006-Pyramimonas_sp.AAC.1
MRTVSLGGLQESGGVAKPTQKRSSNRSWLTEKFEALRMRPSTVDETSHAHRCGQGGGGVAGWRFQKFWRKGILEQVGELTASSDRFTPLACCHIVQLPKESGMLLASPRRGWALPLAANLDQLEAESFHVGVRRRASVSKTMRRDPKILKLEWLENLLDGFLEKWQRQMSEDPFAV